MRSIHIASAVAALLSVSLAAPGSTAEGRTVTVTGETVDTWCYFSGVMGGPDVVTGSAHHTCALWCAAGGIPVGLLADDGTMYMVLKLGEESDAAGGDGFLLVASNQLTAQGTLYERDGINYIVVSEVLVDDGITNLTHGEYGVIPGFAIPKPKEE
ncbi:MAG: hypothetical protein AAGE13_03260 [Pseudomonadota bacterium]